MLKKVATPLQKQISCCRFHLSERADGKVVFTILKQSVTGGAACAPSTFKEQTLPKEPECHSSTQQEEQPHELTLPPEDPLQDEQDPEELPQASDCHGLPPGFSYL